MTETTYQPDPDEDDGTDDEDLETPAVPAEAEQIETDDPETLPPDEEDQADESAEA